MHANAPLMDCHSVQQLTMPLCQYLNSTTMLLFFQNGKTVLMLISQRAVDLVEQHVILLSSLQLFVLVLGAPHIFAQTHTQSQFKACFLPDVCTPCVNGASNFTSCAICDHNQPTSMSVKNFIAHIKTHPEYRFIDPNSLQ
jgi:hypothetical protein